MHAQTSHASMPNDLQPPCRVRLICLACSPLNLEQYRAWSRALNDPIELVAIDLQREAGCHPSDLQRAPSTFAHTIVERLKPFLSQPHALFGQGVGAYMAFEVARLTEQGHPGQTCRLFVSNCDSPSLGTPEKSEHSLHTPMTVLYSPGSLAATLGWHTFARRELEFVELPEQGADYSSYSQRLVRIFNTHLSLLNF